MALTPASAPCPVSGSSLGQMCKETHVFEQIDLSSNSPLNGTAGRISRQCAWSLKISQPPYKTIGASVETGTQRAPKYSPLRTPPLHHAAIQVPTGNAICFAHAGCLLSWNGGRAPGQFSLRKIPIGRLNHYENRHALLNFHN